MTGAGRAALFYAPRAPMEIVEFPVPDPGPGCVVVRVTRANVCGSDLHIWRGDGSLGAMARPEGTMLGHEMTGVIHALGPDVVSDSAGAPLAEGDRVVYQYFAPCGRCRSCLRGLSSACPYSLRTMRGRPSDPPHFRGAFADYYYVRAGQAIFAVPDQLTDRVVAGVNCALSQVIHGLERVGVGFGDVVVIQGAGGLGFYATAVARQRGAHRIIVIDGIDSRLELARSMGADDVIDFRDVTTAQDRVRRVKELTGGWGADVVCELVGIPEVIPEGLRMLGLGGRYLEIGTFYTGRPVEVDFGYLVSSNQRIECVGSYDSRSLKQAIDFLERNVGRLPLDEALADYPLASINEAFTDQDAGRVTRASIVMN